MQPVACNDACSRLRCTALRRPGCQLAHHLAAAARLLAASLSGPASHPSAARAAPERAGVANVADRVAGAAADAAANVSTQPVAAAQQQAQAPRQRPPHAPPPKFHEGAPPPPPQQQPEAAAQPQQSLALQQQQQQQQAGMAQPGSEQQQDGGEGSKGALRMWGDAVHVVHAGLLSGGRCGPAWGLDLVPGASQRAQRLRLRVAAPAHS